MEQQAQVRAHGAKPDLSAGTDAEHDRSLSVIVRAGERSYALAIDRVHDMLSTPPTTILPETPNFVRGVVNIRGLVLPLLDFRRRLGLASALHETDTMIKMLKEREQDHRRWLAELQAAIVEKRTFTLATDPHQCAFGKWYDNYRSPSLVLANHLAKFDEPHKRIHGIAVTALGLRDEGKVDDALALITRTKDTDLSLMIDLFDRVYRLFDEVRREITVVLNGADGELVGLAVDEVRSVEDVTVTRSNRIDHNHLNQGSLIDEMGFLRDGKTVVAVVNIDRLLLPLDQLAREGGLISGET
jgi:purine-binding chemotaxis protein CheW